MQDNQQSGQSLEDVLPPEDQEMHNKVFGLSRSMLYDKQFMPKAKEVFERAPSPSAGAATLAVTIGTKIIQSAREAGQEISSNVLLTAGMSLMQEIGEFAGEILGVQMTDEQIEGATYSAADQLQEIIRKHGGVRFDVSPEERQQMAQAAPGADAIRQKITGALMPQAQTPPQSQGLGRRV